MWKLVLLALCLVGQNSVGRTIQWFCDPGGLNRFSDGSPLDGTMRFELGVFTGGFVPTAANRGEWSAHWVAAERVGYNSSNAVFSGSVIVTGNEGPFTLGARAYIWGFTGELQDGEWILATRATWTWPAPNPFSPFDLEWRITDADVVPAGAVHASGNPFAFQTEAVPVSVPPVTTWLQWQEEELAGASAKEPDDDPDQDGLSNLEEYAYGTPPLAATPAKGPAPMLVSSGPEQHLAIVVPLRADREVALEIGVSEDLTTWAYDPALSALVSEAPASVTYRTVQPLGAASRLFLRTRLSLAE